MNMSLSPTEFAVIDSATKSRFRLSTNQWRRQIENIRLFKNCHWWFPTCPRSELEVEKAFNGDINAEVYSYISASPRKQLNEELIVTRFSVIGDIEVNQRTPIWDAYYKKWLLPPPGITESPYVMVWYYKRVDPKWLVIVLVIGTWLTEKWVILLKIRLPSVIFTSANRSILQK